MADRKHRTHFDVTAKDAATQVFDKVDQGLGKLQARMLTVSAVTGAVGAAVAAFSVDAAKYRAMLDDLSDTTGDNVRTLDGMVRSWRIATGAVEGLDIVLAKFARNLNAADDEGKAAAQAIEAIGLNVDELRAKKPAEAMIDVARALGKWEDGQAKVAVATALMGREGARVLPFMKDIAEQGVEQGKITAEQAQQAERLEKEWRRLILVWQDGKQEIATGVIPWLAKMIEQMREGTKIAGGFWNAVLLFGLTMKPQSPGKTIQEANKTIEEYLDSRRRLEGLTGYESQLANIDRGIANAEKVKRFAQFLQMQEAMDLAGPENWDARDYQARAKPRLNFVPAKAGKKEREVKPLTAAQIARMQAESMEDFEKQIAKDLELQREARAEEQRRAEGYIDMIDPIRAIQRQWTEIGRLRRADLLTEQEYTDVYLHLAEQADKARLAQEGLTKEAARTENAFAQVGFTATSALEDIIVKGGDARDVLQALLQDISRIVFRASLGDPMAAGISAWARSLFGGGRSTSSFDEAGFADVSWLGNNARGGSYIVGGPGSTDSRLVAFRATPGERVDITPQGKGRAGSTFYIDARGADRAGLARLERTLVALDASIEHRAVGAVFSKMKQGARP